VIEVLPRDGETEKFELTAGRMCTSMAGDMLVGAFVPTSEKTPFDISVSLRQRLESSIGSRGDK
jgi:hypothetical protein